MHAARQIFQIHLMHDTKAWWHNAKSVKCLHTPFHELITLVVAREFQFHVQIQRAFLTEMIDLHRVIHNQINWHQWFDVFGFDAHFAGYVAHGGQVGQQRHAGEILQDDARNYKRNFIVALSSRAPVGQLFDVFFSDFFAVAVTQHRFQYDTNRHWQPGNFNAEFFFQRGQRIELTFFRIRKLKFFQSFKCVLTHNFSL